ncbi:transposase [Paucibacter soli]|uniref:transposase n=1 Tax=Paucibacter soli TaxID=3133433 RepID=UPI0030B2597E
MSSTIIRTEAHSLTTSPEVRADVERTIAAYRRAVRALSGVILVHWPSLAKAKSKCQAVEALFHATARRPVVRYAVLDRLLGKMPSYLRRAAIEHAYGAVASFLSNYSNWLDGEIGGKARAVGSRPPRLGFSNVFPSLYGGNMILVGAGLRTVQVKLLRADGTWSFSAPLALKGRFKRLLPAANKMDLCPTLMQRGAKVWLSCPVELTGVMRPPKYLTNKSFAAGAPESSRVCSVDVGINTAATAAIVDSTGTVIARTFLTCGRHNDRRDALAAAIAGKQSLSGSVGRGERHAVALHRRIAGYSLDAARTLASELAAFAAAHGAKAFVIEDLKGWRPKGPSRAMRKRFHRFQHRALVQCLAHKAQEQGLRMLEVFARGTSRWAYDGSGKVHRSKENAQLAKFASGKRYNADLNGALNIAARGLAMLLGIKPSNEHKADAGKSSGPVTRMPLVLADIWAHAQALRGASNRPASPAGVLA